MLAVHVLEQGEGLAERAKRALHAGLAIRFRRGVFGFKECANGSRHVLSESEDLFGNVAVLLQRLKCFAERLASLSRCVRR